MRRAPVFLATNAEPFARRTCSNNKPGPAGTDTGKAAARRPSFLPHCQRGLLVRVWTISAFKECSMRALLLLVAGVFPPSPPPSPGPAHPPPAPEPPAHTTKTRCFTAIEGLMDGNADVILKETRRGKTVSAAVLDVCYPADK